MPDYVKQSDFPSESSRTSQRTRFIEPIDDQIIALFQDYYRSNPTGELVTLHVLSALTKDRVVELAEGNNRTLAETKQCLGLRIPILLARHYGPAHIETLRVEDTKKNSTRPVPKDYESIKSWVTAYTPHRKV